MSIKYPTTSKTMLEKISSGDEICWDEFYSRYSPVVIAIARFKGLDDTTAQDICQQVMVQFFQQSKTFRFDPQLGRFRTYFGRIIRAKIADHYRSQRQTSGFAPEENTIDQASEKLFLAEWRKTVLAEAQSELKQRVQPETFQAYILYAVQNRPAEKVAAFLNCPVNQVYQAKKRCFAIMRNILKKLNESDPELQLELSGYEL